MKAVRILIAEDDAMIAMFMADLLVAMGYEVCAITCDESETVAGVAHHAPDLMIVDEGLLDGSGTSAVDEILKTGFVPHIFATGDCNRVLKHDPNAIVLQKPFNAHALLRAIKRAVPPAG